jgi:glycosyltransferase involved in cell wall biosynthesis
MIDDSVPLISVIIPVYNGERFLAGALQNVFAQNYQPLEVIVVDDGSTDGSAAIAATFGEQIRYVYQPNAGPAAARNTGLALATSEVIAFLDVDDLWPAGKLHVQVQQLRQNPALQLIWGYTQTVRGEDAAHANSASPPSLLPLVGSLLLRKTLLQQVGTFDPQLRTSEDVDWLLRIREAAIPLQVMRDVTLIYRLHGAGLTHHKAPAALKTLAALKQSLDRRRGQNDGVAPALRPLLVEETL